MKNRIEESLEYSKEEWRKSPSVYNEAQIAKAQTILKGLEMDINSDSYELSFTEALEVCVTQNMRIQQEGWGDKYWLELNNGRVEQSEDTLEPYSITTFDFAKKWRVLK